MFEIKQIKNYKQFAEMLEKETGFSVTIRIMNKDCSHVHYQINDRFDMTLGVLCVDNGIASFAPFVTLDSAENSQYINICNLVQFDDLIKLVSILNKIFIKDYTED